MIYFIIVIYTLFLVFNYDFKNRNKGFQYHYIILLVLSICVTGFSYRLGMDTVGYMYYFDHNVDDFLYSLKNIADYRYEPIPTLLFSLVKELTGSFVVLQFIIAAFVNITIFWFLRKHSPLFFFSVFLYFLYQYWNINFEIKRESLAISFFLIGIHQILKDDCKTKDYVVYVVFAILASLSHRYAFITLIYPFFRGIKLSKITIAVLIALSIFVFSGLFSVSEIFGRINVITAMFGVEQSVSNYIDKSLAEGSSSIFGFIEGVFLPGLLLLKASKTLPRPLCAYAIVYIFLMIFQSHIFFLYRLGNYLCFFIFIAYSEALKHSLKKNFSMIVIILAVLLMSQIFNKCHKSNYIRYYPYSSIFTEETNPDREREYSELGWMLD